MSLFFEPTVDSGLNVEFVIGKNEQLPQRERAFGGRQHTQVLLTPGFRLDYGQPRKTFMKEESPGMEGCRASLVSARTPT